MRHSAVAIGALLALAAAVGLSAASARAQGPQAVPATPAADPFGRSQLAELAQPAAGAPGGTQLFVSGYVDAGYLRIRQQGPPLTSGSDTSWAYGNSQFTFSAPNDTFTLNEVALTLEAQREEGGVLHGARASVNQYPSRDPDTYGAAGQSATDVSEAFVFVEWTRAWHTRLALGRAPGFVTLEQQEARPPELRLIGHSYVYQAGGGYPYGLQVTARPGAWAIKLGAANGGTKVGTVKPGATETFDLAFFQVKDRLPKGDHYVLSVELRN